MKLERHQERPPGLKATQGQTVRVTRHLALLLAGLVGVPPLLPAAGRIEGRVINGTTNRPVAGQPVQLLLPRGGMQLAAGTSTDASGQFVLNASAIDPNSFYLLQAAYQGVNYHAPVRFDSTGAAQADLTVYDATRTLANLRIPSARLVVRAEGSKVHIQEMFAIENPSQPPRAYVNSDGTFRFHLSPAAGEPTAAVAGLMNMPLPEPVNPGKSPGDFSIQYPLKPGRTIVMVAYDADYSAHRAALADSLPYPIDSLELLVSPATLSVDSSLFQAAGTDSESGSQRLAAKNLKPASALQAEIRGEAAASAPSEIGASEPEVKALPNSMTRLGVPLLFCFLLVLLWALGVRVTKEWAGWKERQRGSPTQKQLAAQVDALFNSLADLDELYAAGKVAEKKYWKERLEVKARLVAMLKKAPPSLRESYAARYTPR